MPEIGLIHDIVMHQGEVMQDFDAESDPKSTDPKSTVAGTANGFSSKKGQERSDSFAFSLENVASRAVKRYGALFPEASGEGFVDQGMVLTVSGFNLFLGYL
jgi:hypothetical protein